MYTGVYINGVLHSKHNDDECACLADAILTLTDKLNCYDDKDDKSGVLDDYKKSIKELVEIKKTYFCGLDLVIKPIGDEYRIEYTIGNKATDGGKAIRTDTYFYSCLDKELNEEFDRRKKELKLAVAKDIPTFDWMVEIGCVNVIKDKQYLYKVMDNTNGTTYCVQVN